MNYPNIEKKLGLHQEVRIIYVVDGFEASYENEEGYYSPESKAHGETIEIALLRLDYKMSHNK